MPFDTFFSSAHKKHYVEVEGANELYEQLCALSFDERMKLINQWKKEGWTPARGVAISKLRFASRGKRWAHIRNDIAKRVDKATKELKQGKRVPRIETNARQYNTCSGAVGRMQSHSSRG